MADGKSKKTWVAPRSGGYAARSVTSGQFVPKSHKSSAASALSQKKAKTPPPGRGSAAKAK